ncbi:MAG: phosphomannomutase/phosphoglucomutase [Phycisphaerales bacterium]|nr:MAG: phosphomannomutase/phosphoglucomutase [Phycisphaerales bacterium]
MDPAIFKGDGIVGTYPDQINEEDAWKIGCASARFLPSLVTGYDRGLARRRCVCVGRDMRTHSESLSQALIEGMRSAGVNVIDVGMIDTPQMYFAINHVGTCGGVQVTGSRGAAKYNGFKIAGLAAIPVSADTGLKDIEHLAKALLHTKGKVTGSIEKLDLSEEYKQHVLKFLLPDIRALKVAVDASNGMAGKAVPMVFGDSPMEIVEINFGHTGRFRHSPDPLVEKNLAQVRAKVKSEKCDLGFCFDGDADRLVMVDEKGAKVGGDLTTALMVPYFLEKKPNSKIVYDLRSSRVVVEEIIRNGGTPRRERSDHSSMKKALRDSHAVFGGELSGRFYYRDNFCADSGVITMAHVLNIASEADKPMSELVAPLRRYFASGDMDFEVEDKRSKIDELARRYSDGQVDRLDGVAVTYKDWWFNARPSNTEPLLWLNVEARTQDLLDEKLNELKMQLGKPV